MAFIPQLFESRTPADSILAVVVADCVRAHLTPPWQSQQDRLKPHSHGAVEDACHTATAATCPHLVPSHRPTLGKQPPQAEQWLLTCHAMSRLETSSKNTTEKGMKKVRYAYPELHHCLLCHWQAGRAWASCARSADRAPEGRAERGAEASSRMLSLGGKQARGT